MLTHAHDVQGHPEFLTRDRVLVAWSTAVHPRLLQSSSSKWEIDKGFDWLSGSLQAGSVNPPVPGDRHISLSDTHSRA